jgi:hypothetical protein
MELNGKRKSQKRKVIVLSISLRPEAFAALEHLKITDRRSRGGVIDQLLDARMKAEHGGNWEHELLQEKGAA